MSDIAALAIAFAAGVLSFVSPCVLPLVPAYLSWMTGLTVAEISESTRRARVIGPAILFVLGFSTVFVAFGATASVLGRVLMEYRDVIEMLAGVVVIAFGVLMLGIIHLPWLYGEARADMGRARSFGRASSYVMGAAFAAGWTPCVGPILGTILTMAGSSGSVSQGSLLLVAYSLGLGVPFVVVAVVFERVSGVMRWLTRHAHVINRVAGVILIAVGVLILTGRFGMLASWLTTTVPSIEINLPGLSQ